MKMKILICTIMALMAAAAGPAAVIDAPHNETTGIKCASCHSYSLWWEYSPTTLHANPDHREIVDAVCRGCHSGSGPGPKALTHSSAVMGSTLHDTWGVGCMDCHNPHYQDQLQWVGSATGPYLITGTIAAAAYNADLDQTTVDYSDATSHPHWPAVGTESADPDWANKSLANPNRGLIFVQDKTAKTNTFLIVAASESQVVVKGKLDSNAIDPTYIDPQTQQQNSATSNTFGLIYGGLVRDTINGKPVNFFDPNGGFVAAGQDTTGICQVCHSTTQRFTADGVMPADTDTRHANYATSNCTSCHQHQDGFKPQAHDNSSFAWAGNCTICHDSNHTVVSIVTNIHGGSCGMCHDTPSGGGPRVDGAAANGVDGSAIGATNDSTCVECHLTKLGLSGGEIHHTSQHEYAARGACTECHADTPGKLAADHTATIQTDGECSGCHQTTAGTAAGAPVALADDKVHDACTTCHGLDGQLLSLSAANDPATPATVIAMQAGNCAACHGSSFDGHTHTHDVSYDASADQSQAAAQPGTPCANCHNDAGASLGSWAAILMEHQNACATCHRYTNADGLNSPPLAESDNAIASGTNVTCVTCHTEKAVGGSQATHGSGHAAGWSAKDQHGYQVNRTGFASCQNCHGVNLASCTTCHANNGFATWNTNCTFCHGERASGRQSPPLDIQGRSDTANTSVGRHDQHVGSSVANTITCVDCHLSHADAIADTNNHLDGNGMAEVILGGAGVYTRASATTATCATSYCHGNFLGGTSTTPNWTSTTAMTCTSCHLTTTQATGEHARHTQYYACSVCHGSGYSATAVNAALHVNGVKNVGGNGSNISTWISSSQSCTPACHGSKPWGGAADTTKPTDGTLTLTAGDGHIDLAWTPAIDEGGLWATNTYQVRFLTGATAPTCFSGTSVSMGTAETFRHNGLSNGTQYSYRVCAFDARGNFSDGSTGTVTAGAGTDTTQP